MPAALHRGIWIAATVSALSAPLGWVVTDRLEQNNEFCVACHLDATTPLHERKMRDSHALPAVNLVSAHYAAEADFLCIDCHGGASLVNRLRVKTVAARDAGRWLIGWFEEPTSMRHPLWDEDCVQCHRGYQARRPDDFHAISDHNIVDFAHRCVDCHRSHPTEGVTREFNYLDRDATLPVCRNCHEEF
jgi:hypothetical protein